MYVIVFFSELNPDFCGLLSVPEDSGLANIFQKTLSKHEPVAILLSDSLVLFIYERENHEFIRGSTSPQ